jgi:hypothetical protein
MSISPIHNSYSSPLLHKFRSNSSRSEASDSSSISELDALADREVEACMYDAFLKNLPVHARGEYRYKEGSKRLSEKSFKRPVV